jgi:hypothetical protein
MKRHWLPFFENLLERTPHALLFLGGKCRSYASVLKLMNVILCGFFKYEIELETKP